MSTVITEPEAAKVPKGKERRGAGDEGGQGRGGDHGSGGSSDGRLSFDSARLGLWLVLASITMLFAAFTSSLLVRRAASDWVPVTTPTLLWWNTLVLLSSSATVELARRALHRGRETAFRRWFGITFALGCAFLVGQFRAWTELASHGVYLASNPASSFFYVLTGAHAVHVVGGVLALLYVFLRAGRYVAAPRRAVAPQLSATYWHFVDALWLYLFVMLFVR